ncbi:type II toxin-antitoxin system HicB family antitoxin [Archaeoglobus sp.]
MKVLNYRVILRKEPEGGYTVIVPALPGCVTYGETIEEAIKMAKEAIELYVESLKAHNEEVPSDDETLEVVVSIANP